MLKSLTDYSTKPSDEDAISWFQRTRGLEANGTANADTRKALVAEYMNRGDRLPDGCAISTLGCGQHFPASDAAPPSENETSDPELKRMDVFLFKKPFGIDPAPPGKSAKPGSTQHSEWCRKANERHDFTLTPEEKFDRRARLIGMLFDANKCFLLPQGLPGIKTIVSMHQEDPDSEMLIVGHAGGDEDLKGADIAFDRAQILGAYLKSKPNIWLNWFGPDKPARARWGTREVQLMLSALPEGEKPFYEGYAAGVTDDKTTVAIAAFQEYSNQNKGTNLPTDGKADFETRKALVEAYMGLEDTTLREDVIPIAHGCEGHFEDTVAASGVDSDDRRLEVFFFPKGIAPRPDKTISSEGSTLYPTWLSKVKETEDFENHGIHVQIIDAVKQPAPFAKVRLKGPTTAESECDEHGIVTFFGLKAGEYTLSSEKNGYKIGVSKIVYPTAKTVQGYAKTQAAT